jgi:hypothetical protein
MWRYRAIPRSVFSRAPSLGAGLIHTAPLVNRATVVLATCMVFGEVARFCFRTTVARWFVFKPKIYLGNFWWVLQWKILVYFMTIWSILQPFEILYGYLVYFVVFWYIFSPF